MRMYRDENRLPPKRGPLLFKKNLIRQRTDNGWIKAELFMDLHVTGEKPVEQEIDDYIVFFNEERPAYSLNYFTPKQYREAHVA